MYYEDEAGNRVYTLKVRESSGGGHRDTRHSGGPSSGPWAAGVAGRAPAEGPRSLHKGAPRPRYCALKCAITKTPHPLHPARHSWLALQKVAPDGTPTKSAHPARFSPDDKFSRERVTLKKRFGLLPTQLPAPEL